MSYQSYLNEKIETAQELGRKDLVKEGKEVLRNYLALVEDKKYKKVLQDLDEGDGHIDNPLWSVLEKIEEGHDTFSCKVITPWAEKVNKACWSNAGESEEVDLNKLPGFTVKTV